MAVVKSLFAESTDSFGGMPSTGSYVQGGAGQVLTKTGVPPSKGASSNRATIEEVARKATQRIREAGNNSNVEGGRPFIFPRSSTVVTCSAWEYRKLSGIRLYVNPSEVTWNIKRRGTITKTAAGHVRNTWRNRFRYYGRPTYYDELEVSFTFQSGNIMPYAGIDMYDPNASPAQMAEYLANIQPPPGLQNFYEFLSLLDQPQVLGAYENRHIVIHHSRVFPTIRLEGFFIDSSPVTFTESAENGNEVIWRATMLVYRTYPMLQSATQLIDMYNKWASTEGAGEAIGEDNTIKYKEWIAAQQKRTEVPTVSVAPKSTPNDSLIDSVIYKDGKAPNYNNPVELRNALKKLGLL